MSRRLLPVLIVTPLLLIGALESRVLAGGAPRMDVCYGDQLEVDVDYSSSSNQRRQSVRVDCTSRSGKFYGAMSVSVSHPVVDGIVEYDAAGADLVKGVLSAALLAQSQGRDVRVVFGGSSIDVIPRGHADYSADFSDS